MAKSIIIHVFDRVKKLSKIKSNKAFIHRFVVDKVQKVTVLSQLKNRVKNFTFFPLEVNIDPLVIEAYHSDDIWMVKKLKSRAFLFKMADVRVVLLQFIVDFDCKLLPRFVVALH
jgi:hypothetical protein